MDRNKIKNDIVFIGSSFLGLSMLSENSYFNIIDVLCLEKRLTGSLIKTAAEKGISVQTFKWIKEFKTIISQYPVVTKFFIYQLDMLVPQNLCKRYSFYNLHRGNLLKNRGPTPDIWPILLGDTETCMSLHKINDKIDSGILIDEYKVDITDVDDVKSIKNKLEEGIPLLLNSLKEYLKGERDGVTVNNGIYRPWVTEEDFTINIKKDSLRTIDRKIRSQRQYNGAILEIKKKRYYILDILDVEKEGKQKKIWVEDDILRVKTGFGKLILKINRNPKYPPPPKFPPSKRV